MDKEIHGVKDSGGLVQIVPTVTATTPEEYGNLYRQARALNKRIHLDFSDGKFAPSLTIGLAQAYWEEADQVDLHLMLQNPETQIEQAISQGASLVIVHAEAAGFVTFWQKAREQLQPHGIKLGVALLGATDPNTVGDALSEADHVLVFTGKLGYYGGELDEAGLDKIKAVRQLNPAAEIAVDGGINVANAAQVVRAGADILDVGGYLQKADNPEEAYAKLKATVQKAQTR